MSVHKFHDALSFDSLKTRFYFEDDFLGAVVLPIWISAAAGTGDVLPFGARPGGVVRIRCGSSGGNITTMNWGGVRILLVSKKVVMECRSDHSSADIGTFIELRHNDSNRIYIRWDTSIPDTNYQLFCVNGGVPTQVDSGILADSEFHIFRIETTTDTVKFYIDGALVGTIVTNIPSDYLEPQFLVSNEGAGRKNNQVDYITIVQAR